MDNSYTPSKTSNNGTAVKTSCVTSNGNGQASPMINGNHQNNYRSSSTNGNCKTNGHSNGVATGYANNVKNSQISSKSTLLSSSSSSSNPPSAMSIIVVCPIIRCYCSCSSSYPCFPFVLFCTRDFCNNHLCSFFYSFAVIL